MSLNLHELVGDALTIVNDWQALVFTKVLTEWKVTSRTPTKTTQRVVAKGKLQPLSGQEIRELGFNLQEYQYFHLYMSGEPTQLDRLRQFGSDTFTCGPYKYRIVGKMPWDDAGWREAYCYRIEYTAPTPEPEQTEGENDTQ